MTSDRPAPRRDGRACRRPAAILILVAAGLTTPAWVDRSVRADAPADRFSIDSEPAVKDAARDVVTLYRSTHRIGFGVPVPDGYVDGGRDMGLDAAGRVSSGREVLVVDRPRDDRLRDLLATAAAAEVRELPVDERIRRITAMVAQAFEPRGDRRPPYPGDDGLANACRGRGVLLGDVPELCNAGVCRHHALLFKLLADEAGLNAALVRGGYLKSGRSSPGAHAWCEVEQADGSLALIDTMRSRGWHITMADPRARNYFDVAHRPLYGPDGVRRTLAIVATTRPPFVDGATLTIVPPRDAGPVTVRYTLDGADPTPDSPVPDGPIRVPASCTVKATAFAADGRVVDRVARNVIVIATTPAAPTGPPAPPSPN